MEHFAEGCCLVITLDIIASFLHGLGFKLEDIIPDLESGLLVHKSPPFRSPFGRNVGIVSGLSAWIATRLCCGQTWESIRQLLLALYSVPLDLLQRPHHRVAKLHLSRLANSMGFNTNVTLAQCSIVHTRFI